MRLWEKVRGLTVTKLLRLGKNAVFEFVDSAGNTNTLSMTELEVLDGLTATTDELNTLDSPTLATGAGTGITGGTGTVAASSVRQIGDLIYTTLFIDLTGLDSDAAEGDIIGVDGTANPCHFGAITAAQCGTIVAGRVECLETPAGGEVDIDIYAADEATGVTDGAVGDLTETALLAYGADWAAEDVGLLTAYPGDGQYLYLTVGTASTPTAGTYTAGKFLIELIGTA